MFVFALSGSYPTRIVGVVGIGHVPGIVQNWGKVTQEDIPPIMRVPPPTLSGRIITLSFKASVVGLLIWGCTKILPINSIKSSVVNLIKVNFIILNIVHSLTINITVTVLNFNLFNSL